MRIRNEIKQTFLLIIPILFLTSLNAVNCSYFTSLVRRRWFIGGNFSSVVQGDGSILEANNFASWNGSMWIGYNNGTNGPITAIYVDNCLNIYIAGQFTTAGGVETGPFAVWRRWKKNWEPLGTLQSITETFNIDTISVDCYQRPPNPAKCQCDVYVGGLFEFQLNNETNNIAKNIMRYNAKKQLWDDLGGVSVHNITTRVKSIDKRNFQLTITTSYGWVGGEGFLKRYSNKGGKDSWFTIPEIQSGQIIEKVLYNPQTFSYRKVIVAGLFDINSTQVSCSNLCLYNSISNEWLSFDTPINSEYITNVAYNGQTTFVSGNLSIAVGENNTMITTTISTLPSSNWLPIGNNNDTEIFSKSVYDFATCSTFSVGCPQNSIAIVGEGDDPNDGYIQFYNANTGEWQAFGGGFNGSGKAYRIISCNFADTNL